MIRLDRDALICDLAETYHIYDMRSLPLQTVATLSAGLRDDSRIKMKAGGVNTVSTYLFWCVHEFEEGKGRGFAWLDTGTHDSLSEASNFIEVIEKRTGLKVGCLEGIALKQGWITPEKIREIAQPMIKNQYGQYLLKLAEEVENKQ